MIRVGPALRGDPGKLTINSGDMEGKGLRTLLRLEALQTREERHGGSPQELQGAHLWKGGRGRVGGRDPGME